MHVWTDGRWVELGALRVGDVTPAPFRYGMAVVGGGMLGVLVGLVASATTSQRDDALWRGLITASLVGALSGSYLGRST
jgi:hypothetical protein